MIHRLPALACCLVLGCSGGSKEPSRGAGSGSTAVPASPSKDAGVDENTRRVVLDVNAHVLVMKPTEFPEYRDVIAIARQIDPEVIATAPFVFAEAYVSTEAGRAPVLLKGMAPEPSRLRTDLEKYFVEGSLAPDHAVDPMPLVLGIDVAKQLKVRLGDLVDVEIAPSDPSRPPGTAPAARGQVTALMRTGFDEYDRALVLTNLAAAQALLGRGDRVMGVELKLTRDGEAARVARLLSQRLGEAYKVLDWCELNRALFGC